MVKKKQNKEKEILSKKRNFALAGSSVGLIVVLLYAVFQDDLLDKTNSSIIFIVILFVAGLGPAYGLASENLRKETKFFSVIGLALLFVITGYLAWAALGLIFHPMTF